MCGSSQRLAALTASGWVQRPVERLATELRTIAAMEHCRERMSDWDVVIVGKRDMIIPAASQLRAWDGHPDVRCVDEPHLPDFGVLIDRLIVDKSLVAQRFVRSVSSYDGEAEVQRRVARRLACIARERFAGKEPGNLLEVGCGTGLLTGELTSLLAPRRLTLWDLAPISEALPGDHRRCDAEMQIRKEPDGSYDLIASASTVQWFNSPAAFVRHCHRVLSSGGVIALSTFGTDNFRELTPYLPATPNYYSPERWRQLLSETGFRDIRVETESVTKEFADTVSLLRHLSDTGVNAVSGHVGPSVTRSILRSGIRRLTYQPMIVTGLR